MPDAPPFRLPPDPEPDAIDRYKDRFGPGAHFGVE